MNIRPPAVAGKFYPGAKNELLRQLGQILHKEEAHIDRSLSEKNIIGGIVPHAGYMYSAYQAIHFFEILKQSRQVFDTFFIINPNHTGYGPELALDEYDYWKTPLGTAEIDKVFYGLLDVPVSAEAHRYEHSGEVILPLLQFSLDYPFRIVPISMLRQNPQTAGQLARAIFEANRHLQKNICVIASSDFSHFVEPEAGKRLDRYVLSQILDFNSNGVYKEIREKHISVCGYGPIMTLIEYSRLVCRHPLNKILRIGHSGEIHDAEEVVDYVSVLFHM